MAGLWNKDEAIHHVDPAPAVANDSSRDGARPSPRAASRSGVFPAFGARARSSSPPGALQVDVLLLETPYCTLRWDSSRALARFSRNGQPYASLVDIEHEGLQVQRVLEQVGRDRLLVDLRAVPPRNDPAFESAITGFRVRLMGGCKQVALLVRTAAGALQVKRYMREDGFRGEVFSDEAAALAYFARPSWTVSPPKIHPIGLAARGRRT